MKRLTTAVFTALILASIGSLGSHASGSDRGNISVALDDFAVNDDLEGRCSQQDPAIASNSTGKSVVIWHDSRYACGTIMGQRYDENGHKIGDNFLISGSRTIYGEDPAVSMNESGSFVVVWRDYRLGYFSIYSQMFDAAGKELGPNTLLSDDIDDEDCSYPTVALRDDGSFVVCWYQETKTRRDEVLMRRFDSLGLPSGPSIVISGTPGNHSRYPRIGMSGDGSFVVTWSERGQHWHEIYARSFNPDGGPVNPPFVVNQAFEDARASRPSISMTSDGRFVITWLMRRIDDDYNAYAKLFDSGGNAITQDILVNAFPDVSSVYNAEVAMAESGEFWVVWPDERDGEDQIRIQHFDPSGNPVGDDESVVSPVMIDHSQVDCDVALIGGNRRLVVYEEGLSLARSIRGAILPRDETDSESFVINDDAASAFQYYPSLACNESGEFALSWLDRREGDYKCYFQLYDDTGVPIGSNLKLSDSILPNVQYPSVAIDSAGRSIVLWSDWGALTGRFVNSSGVPTGSTFKVNDDSLPYIDQYETAMTPTGECVAAFRSTRSEVDSVNGIYFRRYDSDGNPIGGNVMANDCLERTESSPTIAMKDDGVFVIGWYGSESSDTTGIFFRIFDENAIPLTGDVFVAPMPRTEYAYNPCISVDDAGNIAVTWMRFVPEGGISDYDVLLRRYDNLGDPLGSEVLVTSSGAEHNYLRPRIAARDDGRLAVVWQDRSAVNRNVLVQYFASDGTPIGENSPIPMDPNSTGFRQEYPNVAGNNSSVFMTWLDARRGQGYDIYAKRVDWPTPLRHDVDGSGTVDIDDVVALIGFVFGNNADSFPLTAGDVNRSGSTDIDDVVELIAFILSG